MPSVSKTSNYYDFSIVITVASWKWGRGCIMMIMSIMQFPGFDTEPNFDYDYKLIGPALANSTFDIEGVIPWSKPIYLVAWWLVMTLFIRKYSTVLQCLSLP